MSTVGTSYAAGGAAYQRQSQSPSGAEESSGSGEATDGPGKSDQVTGGSGPEAGSTSEAAPASESASASEANLSGGAPEASQAQLTSKEEKAIAENFPRDEKLEMRLYGRSRETGSLGPSETGQNLDVTG